MKKKPLIILIVNHGWTIRNFLLSDFYSEITKKSNVVICTNLNDHDFMKLGLENIRKIKLIKFKYSWFHERISSRRTQYHFFYSGLVTHKMKISRALSGIVLLKKIRIKFEFLIFRLIGGQAILKILDKMDRWFCTYSKTGQGYMNIFTKLKPDLVFSTFSVSLDEHIPIYVAQKMGIKTATNITSWDNISSKGRLPIGCDKYIVWSDHMKQEVKSLHAEIKNNEIEVSGTPQYDFNLNKDIYESRIDFCKRNNIDWNKMSILYAGCSPGLMPFFAILTTSS